MSCRSGLIKEEDPRKATCMRWTNHFMFGFVFYIPRKRTRSNFTFSLVIMISLIISCCLGKWACSSNGAWSFTCDFIFAKKHGMMLPSHNACVPFDCFMDVAGGMYFHFHFLLSSFLWEILVESAAEGFICNFKLFYSRLWQTKEQE